MSYTALYRKYRPDVFEDVKGQDHVVITLRNQIASGRIGHAYLFTGTRGTGKTTVAKIFAKAVNCEHPDNGSPCNDCPACREIAGGTSMNVIEIDAASNNGVDDVRRIREEVTYSPTNARYKVYIIDEAHMLSTQAFNALLKTLEEPPAYVIFILATTEVHKIPVTILSRCQRYDFHRISQEEITARLQELMRQEGVKADEKALRYIARKAEGGMRDALSLADQCISFYLGQELTYERVLDLLGAVDYAQLGEFYEKIIAGDVAGVLSDLERMIFRGRDLTQLVSDMLAYVRDLMVLKCSPDARDILDVTEERLQSMAETSARVEEDTLIRQIRIFSEMGSMLRTASNRRVTLETALIRMCRPQMETDVTSLAERVRELERIIERGDFISRTAPQPSGKQQISPAGVRSPEENAVKYERAAPQQLQILKNEWKNLIGMQKDQFMIRVMKTARLSFDPSDEGSETVYIESDEPWADSEALAGGEKLQGLEELIEDRIGSRIHVKVVPRGRMGAAQQKLREIIVEKNLRNLVGSDIDIESES